MLIFFACMVIYFVKRINKKNGGVALYINDGIQYKISDNLSVNIDNCLECVIVRLLLKQNIVWRF